MRVRCRRTRPRRAPTLYSPDDRPAPPRLLRPVLDRLRARLARARRRARRVVREPQHPAGRRAGAPPREHAALQPGGRHRADRAGARGEAAEWRAWRDGLAAAAPDERCSPVSGCGWTRPARRRGRSGFSRFSTTLTVSPYQRHDLIVAAGETAADVHGVDFVYLDARDRFRDSYGECRRLELYRQPYCGCSASKWESWLERHEATAGERVSRQARASRSPIWTTNCRTELIAQTPVGAARRLSPARRRRATTGRSRTASSRTCRRC